MTALIDGSKSPDDVSTSAHRSATLRVPSTLRSKSAGGFRAVRAACSNSDIAILAAILDELGWEHWWQQAFDSRLPASRGEGSPW